MKKVADGLDVDDERPKDVLWREQGETGERRRQTAPPALEPQDAVARMLGVPLLGIVIPQVTGSFGALTPADSMYWVGFVAFIGLSGLLWEGNRWLLIQVRRRLDWLQAPIQKLLVLVAANIAFTAPVTVGAMRLWFEVAGVPTPDWGIIKVVTLVCVLSVIIVSITYETVFLLQQRVGDAFTVEQLERARLEAQLEALKHQVDPHFVLNALNALAHLIERDRDRALEFIETLADLYRYVLDTRERSLVLLGEELAFARHYHALAQLRFGAALRLDIDSNVLPAAGRMRIPPISLQVLLENAVKHNVVAESSPLAVRVHVEDRAIVVSNPRRPARSRPHSSRVGLQNLDARCRLLTGRGIEVDEGDDRFVVRVPIVDR